MLELLKMLAASLESECVVDETEMFSFWTVLQGCLENTDFILVFLFTTEQRRPVRCCTAWSLI